MGHANMTTEMDSTINNQVDNISIERKQIIQQRQQNFKLGYRDVDIKSTN